MEKKLPIVFSRFYDVALGGAEASHPAGARRYGKIFNLLKSELGIDEDGIQTPFCVSDKELLTVHTKRYLDSLYSSETIARIAEFNFIARIPNKILQDRLLRSVRFAVGGTIRACELALEDTWAINLSGGYHHAKSDEGGGFCFFSDIALGVLKILNRHKGMSVLIVDLDAHQGNGYASIFGDDERIGILDVYNEDIYPRDEEAKRYIRYHHPVKSNVGDESYLAIIEKAVPAAMESMKPGFVFYIAGVDLFEGDALGCMAISSAGILERDAIVFGNAVTRGIPAVMVLGGGYTKEAAPIMGKSIVNLVRNVIGYGE